MKKKGLSAAKAKKILKDGYVKGKPLTEKQKKFFGSIADGATPLKKINGGWLDKYNDGGSVQPNYNDSKVSLPPGFKGWGYDNSPSGYNPAWNGPVAQNGLELNKKYIDSTFNANMDKRWVQRLYEKNPEFYLEGQTEPSTHFMESGDGYVYPRVMEGDDKQLKAVSREEGRAQGIKFPDDKIAQWFAKNYKKGTNVLKEYQMGGSLPGATGMMYARTSGTTPEEPTQAKNGGRCWPGYKTVAGKTPFSKGSCQKAQNGQDVNFDSVQRAVRNVESLDGKLMLNPESTAAGLYGQRFSEIRNDYPGTRREFSKDTVAQKEFFKRRFYDGLEASETTPLLRDANDLYNEYSPQIKNFPYSKEDIAVLSNFIGRGGTRKYLGYAIRDGKPLAEALPNVYGPNAKQSNKTPEEYLEKARNYYKDGGSVPNAQNGTISQYEEPAWYEKTLDRLASPMTTLGYLARGEDIPDNLPINMENRNTFDDVIDTVNLAAYIKYAASSKRNFDEGNYLDSGFDALSAIPIIPSFFKRGKGVVKKGLDVENASLREMFNQPNIYPTNNPLPKNMEPYLSRKVYPLNKEQEVFESFLSTKNQLKNIDSKSINYDPDGNIIPNMQTGGVIEDDRGQWAYPGEITKINSNNITMQGVPYPVLGISDTGDMQLMQPEGEYKFKGNNVTEFPMAQKGKTITVNSKNDPRYKAYQDSLKLSNTEKKMYESESGLSYDDLLSTPPFSTSPSYGYTESGKPLYGYKPKQEVIVKKSRPKQQSVTTLKSKDIVQPEMSVEDFDIHVPVVDYWNVTKEVNQNLGSHKKTFRVRDEAELERLKRQQEIDEQTTTGKNNKLIIIPNYNSGRMRKVNISAKNGSLVELDQLTNFTNYNTPQPGGWLDKYN